MDRKERVAAVLPQSMTYREYRELMENLHAQGRTTGHDQSEKQVNFSTLNARRMDRLEKSVPLENAVIHRLGALKRPMLWLVISEAWCGDGAQILPIMAKMADASARIDMRVVLRDENPEFMDAFLTNGARAMPKLIMLDADTFEVLGEWGPRPAPASRMMADWKRDPAGKTKDELQMEMQKWYNLDKGRAIQQEILGILEPILRQGDPSAA